MRWCSRSNRSGSVAGNIAIAVAVGATGSRPLVGIVFGGGATMLMVAPRRDWAALALAGATVMIAALEVLARSDRNGLVALVGLAAVAVAVLAPAGDGQPVERLPE